MLVFVPANNKGGVGKTGLSALFAEYTSKILRKKTLVIDFDPQGNLSQRYLAMEIDPSSPEGYMPPIHPDYDPTDPEDESWDGRSSIADIFYDQGVIPYPTFIDTLEIAPAYGNKLLLAEAVRRSEVVEKVHVRLSEFLACKDVQSAYDVVIIDTAPSKGPLTVSAIKAATHMIIPSIMEDKPIQGVFGMMQLWMQESLLRTEMNQLSLVGILANMFDKRTSLHNELFKSLCDNKSIGKYVIPKIINKRIKYAENDSTDPFPKSIFDLPNSEPVKQEAVEVCDYIAKKVFKDE